MIITKHTAIIEPLCKTVMNSPVELANSGLDSNADPAKVSMWVQALSHPYQWLFHQKGVQGSINRSGGYGHQ